MKTERRRTRGSYLSSTGLRRLLSLTTVASRVGIVVYKPTQLSEAYYLHLFRLHAVDISLVTCSCLRTVWNQSPSVNKIVLPFNTKLLRHINICVCDGDLKIQDGARPQKYIVEFETSMDGWYFNYSWLVWCTQLFVVIAYVKLILRFWNSLFNIEKQCQCDSFRRWRDNVWIARWSSWIEPNP